RRAAQGSCRRTRPSATRTVRSRRRLIEQAELEQRVDERPRLSVAAEQPIDEPGGFAVGRLPRRARAALERPRGRQRRHDAAHEAALSSAKRSRLAVVKEQLRADPVAEHTPAGGEDEPPQGFSSWVPLILVTLVCAGVLIGDVSALESSGG